MEDVCAIWQLRAEVSEDGGQQLGEHSTHSAVVALCSATAYVTEIHACTQVRSQQSNTYCKCSGCCMHVDGVRVSLLHAHEFGACLPAFVLSLFLQYTTVHILSHTCTHKHANSLPQTATYTMLPSILVSMRTVSYTLRVIQSHKPLALHRCIRTMSCRCATVTVLHCHIAICCH